MPTGSGGLRQHAAGGIAGGVHPDTVSVRHSFASAVLLEKCLRPSLADFDNPVPGLPPARRGGKFLHAHAWSPCLENLATHPAIWPIILELTDGKPKLVSTSACRPAAGCCRSGWQTRLSDRCVVRSCTSPARCSGKTLGAMTSAIHTIRTATCTSRLRGPTACTYTAVGR